MGTYTRFYMNFSTIFAGLITIVSGIGKGIGQLFNIPGYAQIIEHYKMIFNCRMVISRTCSTCRYFSHWNGICFNIFIN